MSKILWHNLQILFGHVKVRGRMSAKSMSLEDLQKKNTTWQILQRCFPKIWRRHSYLILANVCKCFSKVEPRRNHGLEFVKIWCFCKNLERQGQASWRQAEPSLILRTNIVLSSIKHPSEWKWLQNIKSRSSWLHNKTNLICLNTWNTFQSQDERRRW